MNAFCLRTRRFDREIKYCADIFLQLTYKYLLFYNCKHFLGIMWFKITRLNIM